MEAASLCVAVVPFEAQADESARNAARVACALADVATRGVQLALFPQWSISGPHGATLAESVDGPSLDTVAMAVDASGVAAGVGWLERGGDGRLYDAYALCFPGGMRVRHRRLNVTQRALHGGHRFTVSDTPFGMRVGILIGDDNDIVENVRMTALLGATLLVAPMNDVAPAHATLAARAADNGLYIACAHPAAREARIVGPDGRMLARRLQRTDGPIIACVQPAQAAASAGRKAFAARRPELYEALARQSQSYPLAQEPERAMPRGSLPISFAVVARNRVPR
ncbi:nitrilase-related carbon-nitrogen hydrolase [Caballeronia sp. LZ065]|uniref:nitrilase-related carbon-nitrogen hydrolase n=1 Tax=Caballeronia sp. LZ065 TaxID=3038571 RepID=UPI00285CEF4F|nr:nitrilase-related carbon-nitrogen hydrolase [Caballeronia sp. LZ065]MDR5779031.1 nitrilase-related carbon-nitrogen hydrolase [Caballeronia sp. LZ065]